jgi:UTP15 C terminal
LRTALAGKEERELVKIIKFLTKYIGDFELTATLVEVGNTIIGISTFVLFGVTKRTN